MKKKNANSSEEGCKSNETRATFIINKLILKKIKAVAYWERITIKQLMETALKNYLGEIEKKIELDEVEFNKD